MKGRYVRKYGILHLSTATHGIECWTFVQNRNLNHESDIFTLDELFPLMQYASSAIITTHYFLITYKQPVAQVKS